MGKQKQSKVAAVVAGQKIKPNYGNTRVISGILDWLLGGVVSGLPAIIAWTMIFGKSKPLTNLYMFEVSGFGRMTTIWVDLLCLLFGFFYYVIVPWYIWPGQTLGKRMMHLKIVRLNSKPLTFNLLVIREFIFLIFVEGMASTMSTYIKVLITTLSRFYVDSYLVIVWTMITVVSMILVFWTKKHMALHDLAVQTIVVAQNK